MSFKEKIQDKLSTLSDKQIYWLFAGILLTVFLLDFLLLMQPQLKTLSKINPKIKLVKEDIKKAEGNIAKTEYYRGEVKKLESDLNSVNINVLHRQDIPLILEKISRISNKNKVRIDQVMPDTISQELLLENDEKRYYILPIEVEGKSAYHDFGRFIEAIEKEDIYLSVHSFNLSAKAGSKQHTLALTLHAVVYEETATWGN